MGKVKYRDKVLDLFKKSPVLNISSLKKLTGKGNVHIMLNSMVKKGIIYRLTRGFYSLHKDPTLMVFCFKPAYLGLQEALSIHNLWEQETNTIILTTKTVREGIRNVNGTNVLLRRVPKNLFFGVEYSHYGSFYVPVSDIEKTFLDMLYFRQPMDKNLLLEFKKRIDRKKLKNYLKCYDGALRQKAEKELK